MDDSETYDAVVIGGGIAGLSAALVLGRARRRVLVIDAGTPRNAPADAAYGFPTRDGATPEHLVGLGRAELEPYGVHFLDGVVDGAEERADLWTVTTTDGEAARGRHLILASGLRDVLPEVPGAREAWGRGLLQCPYCHGWEVRDQALGVIGSTGASLAQALLLRQWSADVTYFPHRLGPVPEEDARRLRARGVRVVEGPVREFLLAGDADHRPRALLGVRVDDGSADGERVPCVAVFCEPGADAGSPLVASLGCELRDDGCIVTDHLGRASRMRVWAVGNAADPAAHLATAAGDAYRTAVAVNAVLVQEDCAVLPDAEGTVRGG
ncbi:thioredoxin reductase [Arthrobacter pityocampae]|uniref:Thioredoxin reductase n=1 Tax=Arthrobacter pityocampae TaxID=547334 RepID=A0A2S5IWA5_9MICC|nr:NAD(P)/FAD-dependent oxidoreductase [Arthrobacter pityocampae]PPB48811.1 thioredoxin reductase [Arthrobacter pityocampae]